MGIPKKSKRKNIEERVSSAIEIASEKDNCLINLKKEELKKVNHSNFKKKMSGRPNLRGRNITKHTVLLNETTSNRFESAFIKERNKFRKQGKKLDRSLLYEIILDEWLKNKGY